MESEEEPGYQEEAEDDEDDDADYDPHADSEEEELNLALAASLVEEMVAPPAAEESDEGSEVEVLEIPENGDGDEGQSEQEEEEEEEGEEEANGVEIGGGGRKECEGSSGSAKPSGVQLDRSFLPNCPICFEPWTSNGPHRVCCIPCGHIYGRSCLEKWLKRCLKNAGECPQCKKKFKQKEIINLYAPLVVVPNDDLEKELRSLRETNESLKLEKAHLLKEIRKHKNDAVDSESSGRQKMPCLERALTGATQRRLFEYYDERWSTSAQTLLENRFVSQNFSRGGSHHCSFVLQNEFMVDGARVMGIDASSRILIFSEKAHRVGGEHVLSKISLLVPNEIDKIQLPRNTGAIRDLCILSNGLALLASLGKKLSLFSMESNNCVLKYDLPCPAWSCSGDLNSPYHIYAGLQNGMLLTFDVRQTARHLESMEGLSRQPVHTIHSIVHNDSTRKILTASSLGPCVWDVGGSGERQFLIPEAENQGVCISLACSSSSDDIVASFRPKVELSNDSMPSQTSMSPSPTGSGSGKLGSHVLIKRVGGGASFHKQEVATGNVSEIRMSKSAIITTEGNNLLFAYGDESSRGVCLWDLPSFQVYNRLKPHRHPILDLKYARAAGPGFLGCISEDRLQVFTCF